MTTTSVAAPTRPTRPASHRSPSTRPNPGRPSCTSLNRRGTRLALFLDASGQPGPAVPPSIGPSPDGPSRTGPDCPGTGPALFLDSSNQPGPAGLPSTGPNSGRSSRTGSDQTGTGRAMRLASVGAGGKGQHVGTRGASPDRAALPLSRHAAPTLGKDQRPARGRGAGRRRAGEGDLDIAVRQRLIGDRATAGQQDGVLAATSPGRARPGASRHPAGQSGRPVAHLLRSAHAGRAGLDSTVDSGSATLGQRCGQPLPTTLAPARIRPDRTGGDRP